MMPLPKTKPVPKADPRRSLNLTAVSETPGFMIRLLQLQFFEAFYGRFAELGISPADYAALQVLRDNPGIGSSELAAVLRLQLPNLIKILNDFERKGLMRRSRSREDGRAVELMLTAAGEKLMAKAVALTRAYHQDMLAPLTKAEQRQFLQLLNRLVEI